MNQAAQGAMMRTICLAGLRHRSRVALCLLIMFLTARALPLSAQQPVSKFDIERFRIVLGNIKEDLKKNYYDPTYHGMDLDARFKAADETMRQATSLGQILGIIAQVILDLNDSHTFFLPPGRSYRTDYGWRMRIIGDSVTWWPSNVGVMLKPRA